LTLIRIKFRTASLWPAVFAQFECVLD